MATKTLVLKPEPLAAESFEPYGWILQGGTGPGDFSRAKLDLWHFPFHSDAQPRLQVMRYHHQPMVFSKLERHLAVTEARYPMNGGKAVLIVAAASDSADRPTVPEIEQVRAFILDGTKGIMFKKGTWHGLDCYPLTPPHVDFLFLSDIETEREIEGQLEPVTGSRTHVFDFAEANDVEFEVPASW